MRAAENQRVDATLLETSEIGFHGHLDDFVVRPALFNKRHEQRARPAIDFDRRVRRFERTSISAALNRRLGADNTNFFTSCALDCAPYPRLDHADHW